MSLEDTSRLHSLDEKAPLSSESKLSHISSIASSSHLSEGTSFPHKLHQMLELETAKSDGRPNGSIQWEKHGLTFRILDSSKFESETIPKYFKRKHDI